MDRFYVGNTPKVFRVSDLVSSKDPQNSLWPVFCLFVSSRDLRDSSACLRFETNCVYVYTLLSLSFIIRRDREGEWRFRDSQSALIAREVASVIRQTATLWDVLGLSVRDETSFCRTTRFLLFVDCFRLKDKWQTSFISANLGYQSTTGVYHAWTEEILYSSVRPWAIWMTLWRSKILRSCKWFLFFWLRLNTGAENIPFWKHPVRLGSQVKKIISWVVWSRIEHNRSFVQKIAGPEKLEIEPIRKTALD